MGMTEKLAPASMPANINPFLSLKLTMTMEAMPQDIDLSCERTRWTLAKRSNRENQDMRGSPGLQGRAWARRPQRSAAGKSGRRCCDVREAPIAIMPCLAARSLAAAVTGDGSLPTRIQEGRGKRTEKTGNGRPFDALRQEFRAVRGSPPRRGRFHQLAHHR